LSLRLFLRSSSCSTDDNAFGDDSEQQQQQPQHEAPLDDDFGLSSPPPAGAAASSGGADVDPFATVDGGSTSNAGAFDSFTNNPAEAKEEQQEALASVDSNNNRSLFFCTAVAAAASGAVDEAQLSADLSTFLQPAQRCPVDDFSDGSLSRCSIACLPCSLWEQERAVVLRERAAKAEADKAAMLAQAKDEITKFYADRDAQLAKSQKTNRYEPNEMNRQAGRGKTERKPERWAVGSCWGYVW
jgi:hypothetical protein